MDNFDYKAYLSNNKLFELDFKNTEGDSSEKAKVGKIVDKLQDKLDSAGVFDKAAEFITDSPENYENFIKVASELGFVNLNEGTDPSEVSLEDFDVSDNKVRDIAYDLFKNNKSIESLKENEEAGESQNREIGDIVSLGKIKLDKDLTTVYDRVTKYLTASNDSQDVKADKVKSVLSGTSDYIDSLVTPNEETIEEGYGNSWSKTLTGKYDVFDLLDPNASKGDRAAMIQANQEAAYREERLESQKRMERAMDQQLESQRRREAAEDARQAEISRQQAEEKVESIIANWTSSSFKIDELRADDDIKDVLKKSVPFINRILFQDALNDNEDVIYAAQRKGDKYLVQLFAKDLDSLRSGTTADGASAQLDVLFDLNDFVNGESNDVKVTLDPSLEVEIAPNKRVVGTAGDVPVSFDPTSKQNMSRAFKSVKGELDTEKRKATDDLLVKMKEAQDAMKKLIAAKKKKEDEEREAAAAKRDSIDSKEKEDLDNIDKELKPLEKLQKTDKYLGILGTAGVTALAAAVPNFLQVSSEYAPYFIGPALIAGIVGSLASGKNAKKINKLKKDKKSIKDKASKDRSDLKEDFGNTVSFDILFENKKAVDNLEDFILNISDDDQDLADAYIISLAQRAEAGEADEMDDWKEEDFLEDFKNFDPSSLNEIKIPKSLKVAALSFLAANTIGLSKIGADYMSNNLDRSNSYNVEMTSKMNKMADDRSDAVENHLEKLYPSEDFEVSGLYQKSADRIAYVIKKGNKTFRVYHDTGDDVGTLLGKASRKVFYSKDDTSSSEWEQEDHGDISPFSDGR